jgi:hypothetical protein
MPVDSSRRPSLVACARACYAHAVHGIFRKWYLSNTF